MMQFGGSFSAPFTVKGVLVISFAANRETPTPAWRVFGRFDGLINAIARAIPGSDRQPVRRGF
jgi:hypothetical protein